MEAQLVQLVEYYLSIHLHENAIFLAERLVTQFPNEINKHLLASCYIYNGQYKPAILILQNSRTPANRYLQARFLIELGQYQEAENTLLLSTNLQHQAFQEWKIILLKDPHKVPNGASGIYLLGIIAQRTDRVERAIELYNLCLQIDPFLWCAYETLVWLGEAKNVPDPSSIFRPTIKNLAHDVCKHPANSNLLRITGGPEATINIGKKNNGIGGGTGGNIVHGSITMTPGGVIIPSPIPSPITPAMRLVSGLISPGLPNNHLHTTNAARRVPVSSLPNIDNGGIIPSTPSNTTATPSMTLMFNTGGLANVHPAFSGLPFPQHNISSISADVSTLHNNTYQGRILHTSGLELSPVPLDMNDEDTTRRLTSNMLANSINSPTNSLSFTSYQNSSLGMVGGNLLSAFATPSSSSVDSRGTKNNPADGKNGRHNNIPSGVHSIPSSTVKATKRTNRHMHSTGSKTMDDKSEHEMQEVGIDQSVIDEVDDEDYNDDSAFVHDQHQDQDGIIDQQSTPIATRPYSSITPSNVPISAIAPGPAGIIMGRKIQARNRPTNTGKQSNTASSTLHGGIPSIPPSSSTIHAVPPNLSDIISTDNHGSGEIYSPIANVSMDTINTVPRKNYNPSLTNETSSTVSLGIASTGGKRHPIRLDFTATPDNTAITTVTPTMSSPSVPNNYQPAHKGKARRVPVTDNTPSNDDGSVPEMSSFDNTTPVNANLNMNDTAPRKGISRVLPSSVQNLLSSSETPPLMAANMQNKINAPPIAKQSYKRTLSNSNDSITDANTPMGRFNMDGTENQGPVDNGMGTTTTNTTSTIPTTDSSRSTVALQLQHGCQIILQLLTALARPLRALAIQYDGPKAIEYIDQIPKLHRETGWVYGIKGRIYYETAKYQQSRTAYETMRRISPERITGLEIYSSVLWHLRMSNELSALSQSMLNFDRQSSITWCIMANAISAQRDHGTALNYLKRALSIDPNCVYAYTLQGHEYLANGDLDMAADSFRQALRINSRYYGAWYGLGTVLFKQEHKAAAESHYRKAIDIHPNSAVLHCYLGMALASNKRYDEAITVLNRASQLDPNNPQAAYQRSQVYMVLNKLDLARLELLTVYESSPKEISILIALGKLCKKLNRIAESIRFFNLALEQTNIHMINLTSSNNERRITNTKIDNTANIIRSLLNNVNNPNAEEDSEWV